MIYTVPNPDNPLDPPLAEGTLTQLANLLEPGKYLAAAVDGYAVTIDVTVLTYATARAA